ncbi:MAG: hypothetical protein ACI906_003931 [Candidatus Latescibacterota bacterium]|jgi:hypothetical protein
MFYLFNRANGVSLIGKAKRLMCLRLNIILPIAVIGLLSPAAVGVDLMA